MSLVLVVLLAIFQLFPVGDRAVDLADRTTHANLIARKIMNEQLEKSYDDILSFTGEETVSGHTTRRGQSLSTTFVHEVAVTQIAGIDAKNIVVTVRWKSGAADVARSAFVRLESSRGQLW